ncbi:MAG: uracil-DNA glycosylase family protein [Paracoccaceae bacterium]|nr:uracil-DNA glycosylase family protein [Paracoccaceae bacterium]
MSQPDIPSPKAQLDSIRRDIRACRICADRFAQTATAHEPRPVIRMSAASPVLIIGQAPGARVHASGLPFDDPSGDRLRGWMGLDRDAFYDLRLISILPMAFCFPGYDAKGADLPPPPACAKTWQQRVMTAIRPPEITLLVGGYAQRHHLGLGRTARVTETVRYWRHHAPRVFPLPHPSWRNTAWLKRNPWFEAELLPALRTRLRELLGPDIVKVDPE